jgi:hypothetical protein
MATTHGLGGWGFSGTSGKSLAKSDPITEDLPYVRAALSKHTVADRTANAGT